LDVASSAPRGGTPAGTAWSGPAAPAKFCPNSKLPKGMIFVLSYKVLEVVCYAAIDN